MNPNLKSYKQFQQNQAISEEAQLLNHSSQLLTYLKEKRKNILDNAYIMTHDMRKIFVIILKAWL